jgi:putative CocE/NonD family hydrolase
MFKCFLGWKNQAGSPDARLQTKLLIGPWIHSQIGGATPGDVSYGPNAIADIPGLHLRWYDRRLKGIENGIDLEPPVRIFVMGENVWRDEYEWPLARTQYRKYYLQSNGRANSLFGDGQLTPDRPVDGASDTFLYNPDDPVPTLGGQTLLVDDSGPKDRRPIERRDDVLVYSTAPLAEDMEVTGHISLVLYATSSAPDTDFTATLTDVHPSGRSIHICEGIIRARFRDSYEEPTLIEPEKIYRYEISLWETSNLFRAGHRIRVEISSSNFPRFDRNLNTGQVPGFDTEMAIAQQTIFHNSQYPSHLLLPVIPRR